MVNFKLGTTQRYDISEEIIKKYNIKEGTLSPFTRLRVIDLNSPDDVHIKKVKAKEDDVHIKKISKEEEIDLIKIDSKKRDEEIDLIKIESNEDDGIDLIKIKKK